LWLLRVFFVKMFDFGRMLSVFWSDISWGSRSESLCLAKCKKGFTMDDERLKGLGGGSYWKELLNRIRDIRSSEKVMYRQVLDLYAIAMDYDPKAEESVHFFKIVQNKLHYAAHGHTAAEVIYYRVDSDKPYLGLTTFAGSKPTQAEAMIAKNYLNEIELRVLNNIVSGYFDMAEVNYIKSYKYVQLYYINSLVKVESMLIVYLTI